jgi:hypothetical protein
LLTVYSAGPIHLSGGPIVVESVGEYTSLGCWTDSTSARALSEKIPPLGQKNTVEACASACAGFTYFGVEFSDEVRLVCSCVIPRKLAKRLVVLLWLVFSYKQPESSRDRLFHGVCWEYH